MQDNMARQLVVQAGKELVKSGLIARTWGNVSCRMDNRLFAITPSGRPYETLSTEEIVLCQITDLAYEGDIKPSSEKGIHALIYQTFPEINFVIHTHQPMASIISAGTFEQMPSVGFELLGAKVPIAAYGLPGTKQLRKNVGAALLHTNSHAIIMAHHGALCFGKDYDETFLAAKQLEEACKKYLQDAFLKASGLKNYEEQSYYDNYISVNTGNSNKTPSSPVPLYSSYRTPEGFILQGEKETHYRYHDDMPQEALIHKQIYRKRKDINYISQDTNPELLAVSAAHTSLVPMLDDFAQIVGSSARCAKTIDAKSVEKALRNRKGVLVPGGGALCCAATESDLQAVRLVMEKDAITQIGTQILGGGKAISSFDCHLMHLVYNISYAKKAKRS